MKRLILAAAVLVMMTPPAWAQDVGSAVVMGGDHGKLAAVEVDTGYGLVIRGGAIGRASGDGMTHTWDWAAGAAWRFRGNMPVSMDLGLDFEPMAPGVMSDAATDMRARIGAAFHVSDRAALVVERSRSLHNGTNYGRWMLGGRIGF